MSIPDWQLPPGVDRGLWDYLHASQMVVNYDEQMHTSPLAGADVAYCERVFRTPGRLLDLGCGTGRLCRALAPKGFACVGVDLSEDMLAKAREFDPANRVEWVQANLVELETFTPESFDYAACLFSTLGMIRGHENRRRVLANARRMLKPTGSLVLHAHNRYFRGLGFSRVCGQFVRSLTNRANAGEVTMLQAYGGAPLTLHHFRYRDAVRLLAETGFRVRECVPLTETATRPRWPQCVNAYGWLFHATCV